MDVVGGAGLRVVAGLCLAAALAACAAQPPTLPAPIVPPAPIAPPKPPALLPPPVPSQAAASVVLASWYGPGFDGKRTASGEVFDQEQLTAASQTLPMGTRVRVTNPENRRSVEVRINDRGPFRRGRKFDLSHRAAAMLGIVHLGTAPVNIAVVHSAPQPQPAPQPRSRYFVQVGSFANFVHAKMLRDHLRHFYRDVRVDLLTAGARKYYRVRMGAFADHTSALIRASQSARLGLPIKIERQ